MYRYAVVLIKSHILSLLPIVNMYAAYNHHNARDTSVKYTRACADLRVGWGIRTIKCT